MPPPETTGAQALGGMTPWTSNSVLLLANAGGQSSNMPVRLNVSTLMVEWISWGWFESSRGSYRYKRSAVPGPGRLSTALAANRRALAASDRTLPSRARQSFIEEAPLQIVAFEGRDRKSVV